MTGIRGVAACYVMLFHYCKNTIAGPLGAVLYHGYLAVDLFFALSGFVLALTYGSSFKGRFKIGAYGDFIYKRVARIYPLYIVVTVLTIAGGFFAIGDPAPANLIAWFENFLMVSGWGLAPTVVIPAWSVSAELAAYLIFPALVALTLKSRKAIAWAVTGLCVLILVYIATRTTAQLRQFMPNGTEDRNGLLDASGPGTIFPLLRCIVEFTLGLLAFRAAPMLAKMRDWMVDSVAVLVMGLMTIGSSDLIVVPLFPVLVIGLAKNTGVAARVLGSKPIYFLGLISYSIYLTHTLVKAVLQQRFSDLFSSYGLPHAYTISCFVTAALTLVISVLTYKMIEEPTRVYLRHLIKVRPRPIEAEPNAS